MNIKYLIATLILFTSQGLWANEQTINKYAVVWDSIAHENPEYQEHIKEQGNKLLELWNNGIVENVYFNIDTNNTIHKTKTSLVFFIAANDKKEANEILKQLPFVKHKVLEYKLHSVGVLWLKQVEDIKK